MVSALFALLMMASIDGSQTVARATCEDGRLTVTVKIHDYARVSGESLAGASDIVTRVYRKVGVSTEWFGVVNQWDRRKQSDHDRELSSLSRTPIAQFTIIVLTEEMAARAGFAPEALGLAAVPATGLGRIAYVVYDRVREVALTTGISEAKLLGFVISQDIASLLQVQESDSSAGLMRRHWDRRDLWQIDVAEPEFSPQVARQLRDSCEQSDLESSRNSR